MQKKKLNIDINEILIIVIASLVLGFFLSLQTRWPILSIEPLNFLSMFFFSLLMLLVFVFSQKFIAWKLDCKTKTKLLSFRRYWFRPLTEHGKAEFPFEFPAWLILPIILFFISGGWIKWLAILNFDVKPKATRIRRRWQELTEADIGKIAIAGPISVLILGIIIRALGFNSLAIICIWLALLALIPIGLGFKILISSRILWFFVFILTILILLLMRIAGTFTTVVMALILAAIATIAYYILYEQ